MFKIPFLLIIVLALSGCVARPVVTKTEDAAKYQAQNLEIKKGVVAAAQTGDWLVIRGYQATDNLVANVTGIPISHAGIFNQEYLQVVEAEGEGVHLSRLEEFIDKSYRLLVIRPRWRTEENGVLAWNAANDLVGKDYDFLGTIGFDFPQKYYCSELSLYVYKKWFTGKEKFPGVIKPGELYLYGTVVYDSLPRDEF